MLNSVLSFTHLARSPNIWFNQDASPPDFLRVFSRGVEGGRRENKEGGKNQRKIWPQIKCSYPTLVHLKLEAEPFIAPGRQAAGTDWTWRARAPGGAGPLRQCRTERLCRACWVLLSQGVSFFTSSVPTPAAATFLFAPYTMVLPSNPWVVQLLPALYNLHQPPQRSLVLHSLSHLTSLFHLLVYLSTQPRYKPLRSRGFSALVLGVPAPT